jgi:hypothetical protein
MISYHTKVHLSKCNGSWVVSTKQTPNFNIQTAAMFVIFVFDKNGLIESCSIKKYGVEVIFNGMTSLLNFIKIYQFVNKLLGGTHKQTDRQTGDLISLTFLF